MASGAFQCLSSSHQDNFTHRTCIQCVLQAWCIYKEAPSAHLLPTASWKHLSRHCQHYAGMGERDRISLSTSQTQVDNTQGC